jgi:exopolysaccharide biosynthesis protein
LREQRGGEGGRRVEVEIYLKKKGKEQSRNNIQLRAEQEEQAIGGRERNEIRWNIFKSQAWKEGKKERERIRKKP